MATTRKRGKIGRPRGRPFVCIDEYGIPRKTDITVRNSGNSTLLDVTVPIDTKCQKRAKRKKLDEVKLKEYWQVIAVMSMILAAILTYVVLEWIFTK